MPSSQRAYTFMSPEHAKGDGGFTNLVCFVADHGNCGRGSRLDVQITVASATVLSNKVAIAVEIHQAICGSARLYPLRRG